MDVRFIGNGLTTTGAVGELILKSFADPEFKKFICLVAFASVTGVRGISEHIAACKRQFTELKIYVGIDQNGTSKEALEALLNLNIDTFVFYTPQHIIYHPKIYIFDGQTKCRIFVGSSNLTLPGLFQNVEASMVTDFNRPDAQGERVLQEINAYYEEMFNGKHKNVQPLTQQLIDDLATKGIIPTEAERKLAQERKTPTKGSDSDELAKNLKSLFPSIKITPAPKGFKKPPTKKELQIIAKIITPAGKKGLLVWRKENLPKSDAQIVAGNTAVTGVIRLGMAKYRVGTRLIDSQTYFKDEVFKQCTWQTKTRNNNSPLYEAQVPFDVTILGTKLGIHTLRVSHDLDRVAGQANVPTTIHWGTALIAQIKQLNITGKTLSLYAPPVGQNAPFYIDIN
jgi:HKD family nuclease